MGVACCNLGILHSNLGQPGRAMECFEDYLRIARKLGDRRGIGIALGNIGVEHMDQGRYQQALGCYQEKLSIAGELGDKHGQSIVLGDLGDLHRVLRDYPGAGDLLDRAIALSRELKMRNYLGGQLKSRAELSLVLGDASGARAASDEALNLAVEMNQGPLAFSCRLLQARITATADPGRAAAMLEELAAGEKEDERLADIQYTLFQVRGEAESRAAAIDRYSALNRKAPSFKYRERLVELGAAPDPA
jgi:tetratricopeptide (TPR) repeat protein